MRLVCLVCLVAVAFSVAAQQKPNLPYLEDVPPPAPKTISIYQDELSVWVDGNIDVAIAALNKDSTAHKVAADVLPKTFMPKAVFPNFGPLTPDGAPSGNILYVLHISVWDSTPNLKDPMKPTSTYDLLSSRWFAYQYYDNNFHRVAADRGKIDLLKSKKNAVLISLAVMRRLNSTLFSAPCLAYKATAKEKTAANVLALEALIGGVLGIKPGSGDTNPKIPGRAVAPVIGLTYRGQTLLASKDDLHSPFDITYAGTATPGNPDAADPNDGGKVKSIVCDQTASPPGETTDKDSEVDPKAPKAGGTQPSTAPSSSLYGCNNLTKTSKCSFIQTVSVEQEQWWDVGVDAAFHGPRENKYALSATNVITQTHTIHSAFIATLDVSPWAHYLPMNKWPYFQVGVPLSGAAFHLPYAGLSLPLPYFKKWVPLSVYGGVSFMRQTFPQTLKVGATTTSTAFMGDLKTDWPRKASYGIELPVSQVVSKIKSSVGGGK